MTKKGDCKGFWLWISIFMTLQDLGKENPVYILLNFFRYEAMFNKFSLSNNRQDEKSFKRSFWPKQNSARVY
jgi:hypothetical protein